MADAYDHWFDATAFYSDGYPKRVTSVLRAFPEIAFAVQRKVVEINPARALEIGPGDRPVIGSVRRAVYVDLVPRFLAKLDGGRVVADARRLPFKPDSFDLVVASDVITHIQPRERPRVLSLWLPLAPRFLVFNPEGGTPQVATSAVSSRELADAFRKAQFGVERREFVAPAEAGDLKMVMLYARRRGVK